MADPFLVLLEEAKRARRANDTSDWVSKAQALVDACHPAQRDFVLDPGKRLAALVARGGGKTTGVRAKLMRGLMMVPKSRQLYVAPTRSAAEELVWIPLKELVDKLEIQAKFHETKKKVTLTRNGSQLQLVGADNKREIEKYRGQPFHEVAIDESASYPTQLLEHLILRVIAPRLGDYDGALTLIGTPGHILSGPFYDVTRPGSETGRLYSERHLEKYRSWERWSIHKWNLTDGAPHVPALARLWENALKEKERNGWTDDNPVWLREYLGNWAADDTENVFKYRPHLDDGTEWNRWEPKKDPKTGIAILPEGDWSFGYGIDMGHSDPFALEIFAWNGVTRDLFHVYSFAKKGMYAKTIAELLIGKELDADNPSGLFGATGWPNNIVADVAGAGGSVLAELANVYGIPIKAAKKARGEKHDAIELFNGDLIDGFLHILKGSTLEEQLMSLQWSVDEYGGLKENKGQANHNTDAAIYIRLETPHQFVSEAEVPPPKPGSNEALERWAEEQEEEAAAEESEFGFLSDDTYDFL